MVSSYLPNALFICSSSNEDATEGSIEQMGINLANEVTKYIQDQCKLKSNQQILLRAITFIGHSLGGLIIRSALPHLDSYKHLMHSFISLGSPHLGYMYNTNSLINAGLWFLKSWKKSTCLQQLSMSDHSEKNQTYLYLLSNQQGLNWFKHVMFVGSN